MGQGAQSTRLSTPPARAQYGTFTLTRNKVAVQFASYGTMGNLF